MAEATAAKQAAAPAVTTEESSLLDQIDGLAKDRDLQHEPRLSLRGDIERIGERMRQEAWQPPDPRR